MSPTPLVRAAVLAAVVLSWSWLRTTVYPADIPVPDARGDVRVVSWNLRNFPEETQDVDRLADTLQRLDADVWVLQEVHDVEALSRLLPAYAWRASEGGGRRGQRLVIAWRPDRVRALGPLQEFEALSLGGRVRPAIALPLQSATGPLTVVGVHLKSGAHGWADRMVQWDILAGVLAERVALGPLLVVGDFNLAGGRPTPTAADEHAAVSERLRSLDLVPLLDVGQCTAYWEGVRRDHWWIASALDAAYFTATVPHTRAWVGGPCARLHCDPVHTSPSYPDRDLGLVSDHCPVVIDLGRSHGT
jgi:endonuclease/exonuclease/phosphatase family metal-dependent hydrolase